MSTNDRSRLIASLLIVTALGLVFVWTAFYIIGMAPAESTQCYFAYTRAFLPADGLLAVLMLIAGVMMMKGHPASRSLSLLAVGALTFHGLIDISFNIYNGIYMYSALDMVLIAVINIWCVGFGVIAAVMIMRTKET